MKKTLLTFFCLMIPCFTLFAGLSGEYRVHGFDPTLPPDGANYSGRLTITKVDGEKNLYNFFWRFEDNSELFGLGLRVGDQLSIVYQNNPLTSAGVQNYRILCRTLEGPWVSFDEKQVGRETARKIGCR